MENSPQNVRGYTDIFTVYDNSDGRPMLSLCSRQMNAFSDVITIQVLVLSSDGNV